MNARQTNSLGHKRLSLLAIVLTGLIAGGASCPAQQEQSDGFELTILHTNDSHGRWQPFTMGIAPEEAGLARRATVINKLRHANTNTLLVDAGDIAQGTTFHRFYKGRAAKELYNTVGYDVVALGNHEFDLGIGPLAELFLQGAAFETVLANADLSAAAELAPLVKPYTIKTFGTFGRQKVAIVGIITDDLAELSPLGAAVRVLPAEETLRGIIAELKTKNINKIIVLSHQGYRRDLEMAKAVTEIDVIVGADSESLLGTPADFPKYLDPPSGPYPTVVSDAAGARLVVQAYNFGRVLGQLNVTFDKQGRAIHWTGRSHHLAAHLPEDPKIKGLVQSYARALETYRETVIGSAVDIVDGARRLVRNAEAPMGNLLTDALLSWAEQHDAQIAIQNGGGIRDSLPKGQIGLHHLQNVLPFDNVVVVADVSGSAILAALEHGFSQVDLKDPAESGGAFPQIAGMRVRVDLRKPVGQRVQDVQVTSGGQSRALKADQTYRVVSNNYLFGGGDGYTHFAGAKNRVDSTLSLADVLQEYIQQNSPISAQAEGRIVIIK